MALTEVLNEMKEKGIGGAVVRVDGTVVESTVALDEVSAGLLSSVTNISDAMLKRSGDKQKEVEVSFGEAFLVMVPLNDHLFCGIIKSRDEKPVVLEYAQKAKAFL